MAKIVCAQRLREVGPSEPVDYDGYTVGDLFSALARDYPKLRGYLLDDQGEIRKHVAVFVNGAMPSRATLLDCPVSETDEVYVLQALSGG